jgi:hypothetical protein
MTMLIISCIAGKKKSTSVGFFEKKKKNRAMYTAFEI